MSATEIILAIWTGLCTSGAIAALIAIRKTNAEAKKTNAEASQINKAAPVSLADLANDTAIKMMAKLNERNDELENEIKKLRDENTTFRERIDAEEDTASKAKELESKLNRVTAAIVRNVVLRRALVPTEIAQKWLTPDEKLIRELETILETKLNIQEV